MAARAVTTTEAALGGVLASAVAGAGEGAGTDVVGGAGNTDVEGGAGNPLGIKAEVEVGSIVGFF